MGQVGSSQDNNMVMHSMSGESCRHTESLKFVGVVFCDPGVISLIAIGCGSSHRFNRKCMYIHKEGS